MSEEKDNPPITSSKLLKVSPPKAKVHSGNPSTQVLSGKKVLGGICAKVISPQSPGPLGVSPSAVRCNGLPLFNAKAIQPKPHPVWHHRLPQVISPDLGVHRTAIRNLHLTRPLVRLHKLTFKLPLLTIQETAPLTPPNVESRLTWLQAQPKMLTSYPLNAYGPKQRHYYSWYARERLKLDLQTLSLIAICDPMPAQPMTILAWKPGPYGTIAPIISLSGHPEEIHTGRHGLVCKTAQGFELFKLPAPS